MSDLKMQLHINGQERSVHAPAHWTLLEVLRYKVGLTGSKQGCDKGDCGACTVMVDGEALLSCLILAGTCEGREIVTIEGLAQPDCLDPVQYSFDRCGALQCGFCQSGMMMSARALLDENPNPSLGEVNEALGGNLCRCTGYTKIVEAVLKAAEIIREDAHAG